MLITQDGQYPIDLTGPGSHTLVRRLGVGSLSIGPAELDNRADLHVPSDASINWHVFDVFATPAGSPWPRQLRYTGIDTGFFKWAEQRPIEGMSWSPVLTTDLEIDARLSTIQSLHLELSQTQARLHMQLPQGDYRLQVSGDLSRFTATGNMPFMLTLSPQTGRRSSDPALHLPDLSQWGAVTNLTLSNEPLGQPISLDCLKHFPNLESLSLWGNFSDLDQLAQQEKLTDLALRFMPDLVGMPDLDTWPLLKDFIAYNVEENTGKQLRKQVKNREWAGYASVSQLRKPQWWEREYGRPFAAWSKRLAKLANEAYDVAQVALAEAGSLEEAEAAITSFTDRFNTLKGIETTERDDLGEAVWQLTQADRLSRLDQPIPEALAQAWFDAARDY